MAPACSMQSHLDKGFGQLGLTLDSNSLFRKKLWNMVKLESEIPFILFNTYLKCWVWINLISITLQNKYDLWYSLLCTQHKKKVESLNCSIFTYKPSIKHNKIWYQIKEKVILYLHQFRPSFELWRFNDRIHLTVRRSDQENCKNIVFQQLRQRTRN